MSTLAELGFIPEFANSGYMATAVLRNPQRSSPDHYVITTGMILNYGVPDAYGRKGDFVELNIVDTTHPWHEPRKKAFFSVRFDGWFSPAPELCRSVQDRAVKAYFEERGQFGEFYHYPEKGNLWIRPKTGPVPFNESGGYVAPVVPPISTEPFGEPLAMRRELLTQ